MSDCVCCPNGTHTQRDAAPAVGAIPDFVLQRVATVAGVNGLSTGTTTLYTVPTGKKFVPVLLVPRVTAATAVISGPTVGAGIASGEDDQFTVVALSMLVADRAAVLTPLLGARVADAGEVVKAGIDVAGVGTALTLSFDLFGYILS